MSLAPASCGNGDDDGSSGDGSSKGGPPSSSSSTTTPSAAPTATTMTTSVACAAVLPSTPAGPLCSCSASTETGGVGGVVYSGEACGGDVTAADTSSSQACCADASYPASGSCSCDPVYTPWTCSYADEAASVHAGAVDCFCEYSSKGEYSTPTTTCNTTPDSADTDGYARACCADPVSLSCACHDDGANYTTCDAGLVNVADCSTPTLAGVAVKMPSTCPPGKTAVSFCSTEAQIEAGEPTSTGSGSGSSGGAGSTTGSGGGGGTTTGSGGTNICPQGPGTCRDGDSSTCRCGTACVQADVCPGCAYECVKGCATNADCAGFFSSSENGAVPQPLVCIGATAMMPTAHCGI